MPERRLAALAAWLRRLLHRVRRRRARPAAGVEDRGARAVPMAQQRVGLIQRPTHVTLNPAWVPNGGELAMREPHVRPTRGRGDVALARLPQRDSAGAGGTGTLLPPLPPPLCFGAANLRLFFVRSGGSSIRGGAECSDLSCVLTSFLALLIVSLLLSCLTRSRRRRCRAVTQARCSDAPNTHRQPRALAAGALPTTGAYTSLPSFYIYYAYRAARNHLCSFLFGRELQLEESILVLQAELERSEAKIAISSREIERCRGLLHQRAGLLASLLLPSDDSTDMGAAGLHHRKVAEMSTLLLDILNWKLGQGPPLSRTHFWRAYAVCEAMVRDLAPSPEAALTCSRQLQRLVLEFELQRTGVPLEWRWRRADSDAFSPSSAHSAGNRRRRAAGGGSGEGSSESGGSGGGGLCGRIAVGPILSDVCGDVGIGQCWGRGGDGGGSGGQSGGRSEDGGRDCGDVGIGVNIGNGTGGGRADSGCGCDRDSLHEVNLPPSLSPASDTEGEDELWVLQLNREIAISQLMEDAAPADAAGGWVVCGKNKLHAEEILEREKRILWRMEQPGATVRGIPAAVVEHARDQANALLRRYQGHPEQEPYIRSWLRSIRRAATPPSLHISLADWEATASRPQPAKLQALTLSHVPSPSDATVSAAGCGQQGSDATRGARLHRPRGGTGQGQRGDATGNAAGHAQRGHHEAVGSAGQAQREAEAIAGAVGQRQWGESATASAVGQAHQGAAPAPSAPFAAPAAAAAALDPCPLVRLWTIPVGGTLVWINDLPCGSTVSVRVGGVARTLLAGERFELLMHTVGVGTYGWRRLQPAGKHGGGNTGGGAGNNTGGGGGENTGGRSGTRRGMNISREGGEGGPKRSLFTRYTTEIRVFAVDAITQYGTFCEPSVRRRATGRLAGAGDEGEGRTGGLFDGDKGEGVLGEGGDGEDGSDEGDTGEGRTGEGDLDEGGRVGGDKGAGRAGEGGTDKEGNCGQSSAVGEAGHFVIASGEGEPSLECAEAGSTGGELDGGRLRVPEREGGPLRAPEIEALELHDAEDIEGLKARLPPVARTLGQATAHLPQERGIQAPASSTAHAPSTRCPDARAPDISLMVSSPHHAPTPSPNASTPTACVRPGAISRQTLHAAPQHAVNEAHHNTVVAAVHTEPSHTINQTDPSHTINGTDPAHAIHEPEHSLTINEADHTAAVAAAAAALVRFVAFARSTVTSISDRTGALSLLPAISEHARALEQTSARLAVVTGCTPRVQALLNSLQRLPSTRDARRRSCDALCCEFTAYTRESGSLSVSLEAHAACLMLTAVRCALAGPAPRAREQLRRLNSPQVEAARCILLTAAQTAHPASAAALQAAAARLQLTAQALGRLKRILPPEARAVLCGEGLAVIPAQRIPRPPLTAISVPAESQGTVQRDSLALETATSSIIPTSAPAVTPTQRAPRPPLIAIPNPTQTQPAAPSGSATSVRTPTSAMTPPPHRPRPPLPAIPNPTHTQSVDVSATQIATSALTPDTPCRATTRRFPGTPHPTSPSACPHAPSAQLTAVAPEAVTPTAIYITIPKATPESSATPAYGFATPVSTSACPHIATVPPDAFTPTDTPASSSPTSAAPASATLAYGSACTEVRHLDSQIETQRLPSAFGAVTPTLGLATPAAAAFPSDTVAAVSSCPEVQRLDGQIDSQRLQLARQREVLLARKRSRSGAKGGEASPGEGAGGPVLSGGNRAGQDLNGQEEVLEARRRSRSGVKGGDVSPLSAELSCGGESSGVKGDGASPCEEFAGAILDGDNRAGKDMSGKEEVERPLSNGEGGAGPAVDEGERAGHNLYEACLAVGEASAVPNAGPVVIGENRTGKGLNGEGEAGLVLNDVEGVAHKLCEAGLATGEASAIVAGGGEAGPVLNEEEEGATPVLNGEDEAGRISCLADESAGHFLHEDEEGADPALHGQEQMGRVSCPPEESAGPVGNKEEEADRISNGGEEEVRTVTWSHDKRRNERLQRARLHRHRELQAKPLAGAIAHGAVRAAKTFEVGQSASPPVTSRESPRRDSSPVMAYLASPDVGGELTV